MTENMFDDMSYLDDDAIKSINLCNEAIESLESAQRIVMKVFNERSHILYSPNQAISSPELNEIKVELFTALELCKQVRYLSEKLPF